LPLQKNIVLVTTKQPSSNPRLVKEAIALAGAGYDVSVVYNFWSNWAEDADKSILQANRNVSWIKVSSHPVTHRIAYWYTKIRYKCYRMLAGIVPGYTALQVQAATQFYPELKKKCCSIKADLYIAHNLGALAAAAVAAKQNNASYAFDAEDFHRAQEDNNYQEANRTSLIEDRYFPGAAFIVAASPLIAKEYKKYYPAIDFVVVNNVFRKQQQPAFVPVPQAPLKLFWFSQTVGLKRGVQDVIQALNRITAFTIEFTITGDVNDDVKQTLLQILINHKHHIIFMPPCSEERLIAYAAQQHIGFAIEPGFSINNKIALSNKLFTYLLAGNAVIVSATPAQKLFYDEYPQIGWCYSTGDIDALVKIIEAAYNDPAYLNSRRQYCWQLANTTLNWENEKEKFLSQVKKAV
jgi:glycosyltransferase involved in cell wall biosynthesis